MGPMTERTRVAVRVPTPLAWRVGAVAVRRRRDGLGSGSVAAIVGEAVDAAAGWPVHDLVARARLVRPWDGPARMLQPRLDQPVVDRLDELVTAVFVRSGAGVTRADVLVPALSEVLPEIRRRRSGELVRITVAPPDDLREAFITQARRIPADGRGGGRIRLLVTAAISRVIDTVAGPRDLLGRHPKALAAPVGRPWQVQVPRDVVEALEYGGWTASGLTPVVSAALADLLAAAGVDHPLVTLGSATPPPPPAAPPVPDQGPAVDIDDDDEFDALLDSFDDSIARARLLLKELSP